MAYTISSVYPNDKRTLAQVDALLEQEGIQRDGNLDYIAARFDEDYKVIATGSETMIIPIPGHEYCITSTDVLNMTAVPASMVVMGGGVIGLEPACAFQAFGCKVTVVECREAVYRNHRLSEDSTYPVGDRR